jgi:hypothetical protein
MAQIRGSVAEDNDNDPVEVRKYSVIGTDLDYALGSYPTSPIYYRGEGQDYYFWQYFPNGIIVSSPNTCACVLFGPIFDYSDSQGEFEGWLGAPLTDVRRLPGRAPVPGQPPPPPSPSYAVFDGGVLYLDTDIGASVTPLSPVPASMVQNATGISPDAAGIAAAAEAVIQGFADNALATDQHLHDNVNSISTSTVFDHTGPGGCSGASFGSGGTSLLRSHVLKVHFDFDLSGCAGVFGNASADVTVEVRLFVDPPNVTARLVNYWIDSVSSPFSAGDSDIRSSLSSALNGQYGKNLLNKTIPSGITVIAGIVSPEGDVNLYIAPICASTSIMMRVTTPDAAITLGKLRLLRDDFLARTDNGAEFVQLVEALGPVLTERLRLERDAPRPREGIAAFLLRTFPDDCELAPIAARLVEPAERTLKLISGLVVVPGGPARADENLG